MSPRKFHTDAIFRRRLAMIFALWFSLLAVSFHSCEPEDWILEADCSECFSEKPDSVNLIVNLTIDAENDSVPLTFYRGNADGEVDWRDTATADPFYLSARIGQEYTVKAEYRSGTETVIAYDSDKMTLSDFGADCGDPCYIVRGGIFDLRLID